MAGNDLANISAAKETWQRAWQLSDQRVQKQLDPVVAKIIGEYSLQTGGDDELNGILLGARFTMCAPWDGDVRKLQIWCAAPTGPVVDPNAPPPDPNAPPAPPLVVVGPPEITLSFTIARRTDPITLLPMSTAAYTTVDQYLELVDTTVVSETDLSGGVNGPVAGNDALSLSGFAPHVFAGDMIYATVTAVTNVGLLGVEMTVVLRPVRVILTLP